MLGLRNHAHLLDNLGRHRFREEITLQRVATEFGHVGSLIHSLDTFRCHLGTEKVADVDDQLDEGLSGLVLNEGSIDLKDVQWQAS